MNISFKNLIFNFTSMIIKKNQLLFIFLVLPLIVYWIYIGFVHELGLKSLYLTNLKDIEYFPVVYALSEFKLNPSFLENLNPNGLIGFPILPLIIHSFFIKYLEFTLLYY